MNDDKIIKFFTLCVITRFLFAISVFYLQKIAIMIPVLACLFFMISFMFFYRFMRYKKGDKGAFGSDIWWNNLRVVHSVMYLIALLFILNGYTRKYTPLILTIDVVLGIIFFQVFRN